MLDSLFSVVKSICIPILKLILTTVSIIFMILAGLLDFVFSIVGLSGDLLHLLRDGYNSATSWVTEKLVLVAQSDSISRFNTWCGSEVL